jgi:hypothetical protein
METKVCKYCGRELPVEDFYRNGFGVTSCCKECHTRKVQEGKQKKKEIQEQVDASANARHLRISEFTPRELMEELKRRGYEFTMRYVETHIIKSEDL